MATMPFSSQPCSVCGASGPIAWHLSSPTEQAARRWAGSACGQAPARSLALASIPTTSAVVVGTTAALAGELSSRLKFGSHPRTDLKSFDAVLFAGGGNLNLYWPELIAWRAAIAAAANVAGVPYVLTGQGVGPVSAEIIPMLSFLVGGASAVATRDPLSLRMLLRIVADGPPIKMVGDDALGLRVDEPRLRGAASRRSACRLIAPYLRSRRERPPTLVSRATSSRILPGKSMTSRRKMVTSSSPCRSTCIPTAPRRACSPIWPTAIAGARVARRESWRRRRGDRRCDQNLQRRFDPQLPCGDIRP